MNTAKSRQPASTIWPGWLGRLIDRYLDPADRLAEIIFGLIMALTFTLGTDALLDENRSWRTMFFAVLGCNAAWGIIDALMYLMTRMFAYSRHAYLLSRIEATRDSKAAMSLCSRELDSLLTPVTSTEERERIYAELIARLRRRGPVRTELTKADLFGAFASFWLVFSTALPAVVPFALIENFQVALRVSNGVLLLGLFSVGYRWGRAVQARAWLVGFGLLAFGVVMVAVAVSLGG